MDHIGDLALSYLVMLDILLVIMLVIQHSLDLARLLMEYEFKHELIMYMALVQWLPVVADTYKVETLVSSMCLRVPQINT